MTVSAIHKEVNCCGDDALRLGDGGMLVCAACFLGAAPLACIAALTDVPMNSAPRRTNGEKKALDGLTLMHPRRFELAAHALPALAELTLHANNAVGNDEERRRTPIPYLPHDPRLG